MLIKFSNSPIKLAVLKKIESNIQARLWRWRTRKDISNFQAELLEYAGQVQTGKVIIFPPGLAWHDPIVQRPQHIARALSEMENLVFYVDPETSPGPAGFERLAEQLVLCHVPMETFRALQNPFLMTMTWNAPYAFQVPNAQLIYDYVDDIQVFSGNQKKLAEQHNRLLQSAAVVLATSTVLHEQVKSKRPDAVLCPNGVDYDHFAAASNGVLDVPVDITPLLCLKSPIIGYIGALARWIDYELIANAAEQNPGFSFLLIGPEHEGSLPGSLLEIPNIFWLGAKSYHEIPLYLKYIDAAMIPFVVNELTHAVSPLKLFEYMAAGKPVIVTPMEGSMHYPGVLVAANSQEFSQRLSEALVLKADPEYINLIKQVARQNTWKARAGTIMQAVQDYINPDTKQKPSLGSNK